ncbi:Pkinase-domain-containing protein [Parathielavia appendiculata]|uniref:non-specific serine/threonine protein kinase n=1 Tax=Parathielavia appendiculata TaxID=2587402 RepID=A0AAN6U168_9PEZI|nr:Pkinase-domain-containing protein [Parathielavia appendiculata]
MAERTTSASSKRTKPGSDDAIGNFVIDKEIGKGSFAQVYSGRHKVTGALVAIKSVELARLNKKLKENLYGEIKILKRLRHPHIVALHDCVESGTHINLIMEYCELGDLSFFIKKRDRLITNPATHELARKYPVAPNSGLNEVVTRHFLKQLASALSFLRKANLIHRDVKPQNLLLLPSPQYREANKMAKQILSASHDSLTPATGLPSLPMLKLADFGFARVLPSTSLAETLCGSPLYMAPEILRYERYDAKADLWSVGTVLYEMATGKPPFRAGNHVELLRKIEATEDLIKFPRECIVSTDMKALIRALLKRNPVERIGFDDFFDHTVISGPIPGLVEDDIPKEERPISGEVRVSPKVDELATLSRKQSLRRYTAEQDPSRESGAPPSPKPRRSSPLATPIEPTPNPGEQVSSPRLSYFPQQEAEEGLGIRRPATVQPSTSAPVRAISYVDRSRRYSNASLKAATRDAQPPPQDPPSRARTKSAAGRPLTEEEKSAQDVAFERDYIFIDKTAVEVNALADQISLYPPQARSPKSGQIVRRATQQGAPTSTTGAVPNHSSRNQPGRNDHYRKVSYDKTLSSSPGGATSVISKAIQDASLRLFGFRYPPQLLGKGQSPPQIYSPFPAYPTPSVPAGLIMDGKLSTPVDEDSRVSQCIEEYATRSDVVYGFAEVKYKQLVPMAPSTEHGLGGVPADRMGEEAEGLTVDAVVSLSEEALVLYVKALSLLAKSMDIASLWWSRKTKADSSNSLHSATRESVNSQALGLKINAAVQWIRSRFNEVLEKAEVVRLKLIEAQKQLPEEHPSHPSNHGPETSAASGSGAEGVFLSPGLSAEKLMYDRAVEMSRTAAINEIASEDLPGCEISYVTAIHMLEAVLDSDDDHLPSKRRVSSSSKEEKQPVAAQDASGDMSSDDKQTVQKMIQMINGRLASLRKRMYAIAAASKAQQQQQQQMTARRRSGDVTPRSVPS